MTFKNIFDQFSWEEIKQSIYSKTKEDVQEALSSRTEGTFKTSEALLEDFKALISPAALPYLEEMALLSHRLTQKRFGKNIQMFVPMYLSNECQNICTYCGFSFDNKIKRITLSDEQILQEVKKIKSLGFDHVLLVTGEATQRVNLTYFKNAMELIRPYFSNISIEVQPLEQEE